MSEALSMEKIRPLSRILRPSAGHHLFPLLLLSVATALGQGLLYSSHVEIPYAPTSVHYIAAAQIILFHLFYGHVVDPIHTLGYPLLLALMFATSGAQDRTVELARRQGLTPAEEGKRMA